MLHRRLAIQDLSSAAAQPMTSDDGLLSLVYNGEIYNAEELRSRLERQGATFKTHSDTEVLLQALRLWGLHETLDSLRGMFAFVLARSDRGQTVIEAAVDHAGMKPLAWAFADAPVTGPTLTIASDTDALIDLLPTRPALDPVGMCHVLSIGYCPQPHSVWRNVYTLRPGHALRWTLGDASSPEVTRWWQPPEVLSAQIDERDFARLFESVVHEHLIGDVPVGIFLSAGLDSSAIALAMMSTERTGRSTVAYSLTSSGPDDESVDAAAFAGALGFRHEIIRLDAPELPDAVRLAATTFDQPQGFSALLTAACLARGLRASSCGRDIKVVLSGDGGDEAFAGYAWHQDALSHPLALGAFRAEVHTDSASRHQRVATPDATPVERDAAGVALAGLSYAHRYLRRLFPGFHPAESRALLGALAPEYDESTYSDWLQADDRQSLPHPRRAQRLDVLGFCAGSINPKVDRACMGVGLELRSPFLDRRVLERGLALPQSAEVGFAKGPIRNYLQAAASKGRIPDRVLARPKQGFSLRLPRKSGEPGPMSTLRSMIDDSRLVRDSVLRSDYQSFLPTDPEAQEVRWFTLAMLAAWYDERF